MAIDCETRIGWIHNLAVEDGLRGQGLGRRLIEHALDHFRRCGMTVARIETLDQNPIGQHLYPSLGFREIARQIHYAVPLVPGQRTMPIARPRTTRPEPFRHVTCTPAPFGEAPCDPFLLPRH